MKNFEGVSDEALALLYVKGDNRAFDELLSRTQTKLFTYIMFVVRDHRHFPRDIRQGHNQVAARVVYRLWQVPVLDYTHCTQLHHGLVSPAAVCPYR